VRRGSPPTPLRNADRIHTGVTPRSSRAISASSRVVTRTECRWGTPSRGSSCIRRSMRSVSVVKRSHEMQVRGDADACALRRTASIISGRSLKMHARTVSAGEHPGANVGGGSVLRAPVMAPASSAQRATNGRPMEPQETGKQLALSKDRGLSRMPDPLDASVGLSDDRSQDKFGCKFCEKQRRGVGIPLAPSEPHGATWDFNYECDAEGERLRVAEAAPGSGSFVKFGNEFPKSGARARAAMAYRCAVRTTVRVVGCSLRGGGGAVSHHW